MRARRPCCIPRSNRRIATFGDGYWTMRDGRRLDTSITHHFNIHWDFTDREPRNEDARKRQKSD